MALALTSKAGRALVEAAPGLLIVWAQWRPALTNLGRKKPLLS